MLTLYTHMNFFTKQSNSLLDQCHSMVSQSFNHHNLKIGVFNSTKNTQKMSSKTNIAYDTSGNPLHKEQINPITQNAAKAYDNVANNVNAAAISATNAVDGAVDGMKKVANNPNLQNVGSTIQNAAQNVANNANLQNVGKTINNAAQNASVQMNKTGNSMKKFANKSGQAMKSVAKGTGKVVGDISKGIVKSGVTGISTGLAKGAIGVLGALAKGGAGNQHYVITPNDVQFLTSNNLLVLKDGKTTHDFKQSQPLKIIYPQQKALGSVSNVLGNLKTAALSYNVEAYHDKLISVTVDILTILSGICAAINEKQSDLFNNNADVSKFYQDLRDMTLLTSYSFTESALTNFKEATPSVMLQHMLGTKNKSIDLYKSKFIRYITPENMVDVVRALKFMAVQLKAVLASRTVYNKYVGGKRKTQKKNSKKRNTKKRASHKKRTSHKKR